MGGVKAKDDLLKLMEATIKEILKIMLLTGMASMWERKDSGMRDSGKIMCLMEMAKLLTLMVQGTSVNSWIIKRMAKEHSTKEVMFIEETSKMIISMEN